MEVNFIIKRDGSVVEFDKEKIVNAIYKAGEESGEFEIGEATFLASKVVEVIGKNLNLEKLSVEAVQDLVEETLLDSQYKKTAKAYIIYRENRAQARKRSLFKKRTSLKPYEYPELAEYVDAIRHSYWIHTEFNYVSDIQDFKVNVAKNEQTAIKNSMLAIAQIEVAVKTFWEIFLKRFQSQKLALLAIPLLRVKLDTMMPTPIF